MRSRRAARWACAPTTRPSSTATSFAAPTRTSPSSSAASRRAFAALPIMTTGPTSSSAPSCSIQAPTCSATAWGSTPSWRWPTRLPRAFPFTTSRSSTERWCGRNRSSMSTITSCCPASKPCTKTASTTRKASTCSTATATRSRASAWWSPIPTTNSWCRTRRRSP